MRSTTCHTTKPEAGAAASPDREPTRQAKGLITPLRTFLAALFLCTSCAPTPAFADVLGGTKLVTLCAHLGAWPVLSTMELPLVQEITPAGALLLALFGVIVFVGGICASAIAILSFIDRLRGKRPESTKLEQPLRIVTEKEVVVVSHMEERLAAIKQEVSTRCSNIESALGQRCQAIEEMMGERFRAMKDQIAANLTTTDKYMHEFRHEMRGELQAITSNAEDRSVKIHERINVVVQSADRTAGRLDLIIPQLQAFLQNALHHPQQTPNQLHLPAQAQS